MTEREKIVKIITDNSECFPDIKKCAECKYKNAEEDDRPFCTTYKIADALIAAGMKFDAISEREYQGYCAYKIIEPQIKGCFDRERALKGQLAEAERALDKAVELAYKLRTEADTLSCSSCPMFHIFDSCKDRGLYKDCAKRWKEELIKQSKKELAEEKR